MTLAVPTVSARLWADSSIRGAAGSRASAEKPSWSGRATSVQLSGASKAARPSVTRRQPSSDLLGDVLRLRGERLQHFYDMGDSTFVTIEVRMCWAGGADGGRVDGG